MTGYTTSQEDRFIAIGAFFSACETLEKKRGGFQQLQKVIGADFLYQSPDKRWFYSTDVLRKKTTSQLKNLTAKVLEHQKAGVNALGKIMKSENILTTAKRIRRENESWQDAIQRAKKQRLSGFSNTMKKTYTKTKELVGDAIDTTRYNTALNVLEKEESKGCYSRRERNNIKDVRRLLSKRKCADNK